MKVLFSVVAMSLGVVGALAAACSSNDGASAPRPPTSGQDSGSGLDSTSAAADAGDTDAPALAPQAFMRIAHASSDLPPIDVCVAPHGTTDFQGPLVGQLAASLAGGDGGDADASLPGLLFTQVSAYLPVTPGQYDVRLVAAGAPDCRASLAEFRAFDVDGGTADAGSADATTGEDSGTEAATLDASASDAAGSVGVADATNLPALAFNTHTTLLIAGDLAPAGTNPGLTLTMLADDAVLAGGAATLRAINTVPSSPSLDFGFSSPGGAWSPVLTSVAFGAASGQVAPGFGTLDANGYLTIAPIAAQPMSARATSWDAGSDSTTDVASASNVEIDMGSIATIFAVGGKTGDTANPPALLLCMDNQPSGGPLSDCSIAR